MKSKPDATEVAERCPLCGSDRLLNDPHDDGSLDAYSCFSCGSEWRNVRKADMQASEPAALPVEPLIAEARDIAAEVGRVYPVGLPSMAATALNKLTSALAAAREREARLTAERDALMHELVHQIHRSLGREQELRADAAEQALREVREKVAALRQAEQDRLVAAYGLPYDHRKIDKANAYLKAIGDVDAALAGSAPPGQAEEE